MPPEMGSTNQIEFAYKTPKESGHKMTILLINAFAWTTTLREHGSIKGKGGTQQDKKER
jgi:hypothetical protein